ncbi:MAG: hypothetical protein WC026_13525 [Hyphomicrobium sp.]
MLRDGGEKVLDKHAVGILAKFDGWRFQLAACGADSGAKLDMRLKPARKAADVIDYDDVRISAAMLLEESEHGKHAGAINNAARCAFIAEYFRHVIALGARVIAAARFLRAKARAACDLLRVGYAAVDDGAGVEAKNVIPSRP